MKTKNEQISELIALNEELENYFKNTIIPQIFVDANLVLRKFTPPAMKQFALSGDHIGRPIEEVTDNFRFPTVIDNIKMVIDTGEILEKEIQTTDMRWYQMNILPYINFTVNKTNGVIITFVEITTRIKDLKEQEKLISEHELLLDTIAHDIKNPIAALGMTIELLKRVPERATQKFPQWLDKVETSLNKVKQVIYDLVQSRWQQNRYQAVEELLDLENILEDVRYSLAPQIQDSRAIIKLEIQASEITFARRKLRSVIYNLVNNALKYSSEKRVPEVLIRSYTEGEFFIISIKDNGIGIDFEHQALIFEKHHRLESSVAGNGVGLYLVKQTIETAGGKITIDSEIDKGSTFKVYLPLSSGANT